MLKYSIPILFSALIGVKTFSQNPKEVTIGAGENLGEVFPIKNKYRFDNFTAGYIVTPESRNIVSPAMSEIILWDVLDSNQ